MFLLTFSTCAGLLLFFPTCTYQSCMQGTPRQCVEAEFAPGSNLAGEGFDITKMELKGAFVLNMNEWQRKDKTCMLCINPYLENKKQKLPLSVVDWRAKQSCSAKVSSELHKSSEALVSSSTSSVENNWKIDLNVEVNENGGKVMLAGTKSKLSKYSMEKTKSDKFSFASTSVYCEYYSYGVSSAPKLHREFNKAVRSLPKVYNSQFKNRFYKLIEDFGTHYITKVKLGGKVDSVTSIRQCEVSLKGLGLEEVGMCLQAEASASVKATLQIEAKHCHKDTENMENTKSFSDLFNDRFTAVKGGHTTEPDLLFSANKNPSAFKEWLNTIPQNPDIVSYSLNSLHELLPVNAPVRKNLRSAISHYILEKGLWRNCSEPCLNGIKSDSKDSCVCQCHNNPAVNSDCCPTHKGMARVIISVIWAAGLWGDHTTKTDAYVKVILPDKTVHRSDVIPNNNSPHWGMEVDLGPTDLSSTNAVRFEVWDQDSGWDDDLLGECHRALSAGIKRDVCALQHGKFFFKTDVQCAPNLGGNTCSDYKPLPVSQSLKSLYASRNAQPIPKAVLLQMGVFVDETRPHSNHSLAFKTPL